MRRTSPAQIAKRSTRAVPAGAARGQAQRRAGSTAAALAEPVEEANRVRRFPAMPGPITPVVVQHLMQDYALGLDPEEPLPAEIEECISLGEPHHYRMRFAPAFAVGHAEFYGLADGVFVHMSDLTHSEPYGMLVSAPNMLRVRIASESDGEYVPARGDILDIRGPSASIIIEPAGQPPAEGVFAGHNRSAQLYIHRDTLKQFFATGGAELPPVLQAFVAGNLQRTVARRLTFSPGMLRCLEDLQGCTMTGHGRRMFIQAKVIEILCHAFEALRQDDADELPEASELTTRGVLKAQRLLIENFVTPPSLDDLAHQVGLSRSGLCAGFRQVVGQTVYDYIADLRMQHALALLNQRNASITQIAYAVGYNHPSSFSVAVQRRFGTTPRELRKRGLPGV